MINMTKKEREFQAFVLDWYKKCGRHDLPWRQTHDQYSVLVSELMLQQTQVVRVIPKYEAFITKWPTVQKLAKASLGDVLRMWQGLGYNRRAKFLLECAQAIVNDCGGRFPDSYGELVKLPGIGPYTASAICAFSYNQPVELIETNVRQVYIHHFSNQIEIVTDTQILEKVRRTLPADQSRQWYAALMDYGTHLKSLYGNNTQKVKGYTKQSKFKGSNREVRGAIVRLLTDTALTKQQMLVKVDRNDVQVVAEQLDGLVAEGLVIKLDAHYRLP